MNAVEKLIKNDRDYPKRILVIGDIMEDIYIQGVINNSQDSCTKFTETSRVVVPGGAANACNSLKNWFTRRSCIGDDLAHITKTRFMSNNTYEFRHDIEKPSGFENIARKRALEHLISWCPEGVLISDYDKGFLDEKTISNIIKHCKSKNIPCVADCKREPKFYEGAILKGNSNYSYKYAEQLRTLESIAITTYGENLPIIWDKGNCYGYNCLIPKINCINHIGAGDCFAAHLVLGLANGLSLKESVAIAHSAGRVYVQNKYNRPPRIEDIESDFNSCKYTI